MPLTVPSAQEVSDKWVRRAAAASQDYRAGIARTTDWAGPTAAAETVYIQAVVEAANAGRFGRGVAAAGTAKWKDRALAVGVPRFATGVAAAESVYRAAIAPVLDLLRSLELVQRGPRGSPENFDRSRAVGEALHQFRLQQLDTTSGRGRA